MFYSKPLIASRSFEWDLTVNWQDQIINKLFTTAIQSEGPCRKGSDHMHWQKSTHTGIYE